MNIVIPTHEPHRNYNFNFLKSFDEFCVDKEKVKITLIVNSYNSHSFFHLKEEFSNLNIQVVTLAQLIKNIDGTLVSDHPSSFFHKYPLQAMKKLFAFSAVEGDYIVMDSENLCLKKFEFSKLFEKLKSKPVLFCDKIFFEEVQGRVINECSSLMESGLKKWCFLKSYWFFERDIVSDLVDEIKMKYGSASSVLRNTFFFDYQLYCSYLHRENLKDFVCVDDIISRPPYDFLQLLNEKQSNFEYICTVLNEENVSRYCDLVNELEEGIVRLHWMPDEIRKKVIEKSNICIGTFHWD